MESISNDIEVAETETITPTSKTVVEFVDLDGNSSVDSLNGVTVSDVKETGSEVIVNYIIPNDESAGAVMFALMGGSNIAQIKTHRVNSEDVAVLTIRHNVETVLDWEIHSYINSESVQVLSIHYLTESAVILGSDFVSEVTKRD